MCTICSNTLAEKARVEAEKEEASVEHVEYDRKKADKNKNLNGRVRHCK